MSRRCSALLSAFHPLALAASMSLHPLRTGKTPILIGAKASRCRDEVPVTDRLIRAGPFSKNKYDLPFGWATGPDD